MATRALIGFVENENEKFPEIEYVYSHYDGYPSNMLPILTTHYNTIENIKALLASGGFRALKESISEISYFGDCEKEKKLLSKFPSSLSKNGVDYGYVFYKNKWYCFNVPFEVDIDMNFAELMALLAKNENSNNTVIDL